MSVLIAIPEIETFAEVIAAALRLLLVIALSVGVAFAIRYTVWRDLGEEGRGMLDGASALLLALVVVGLMAALMAGWSNASPTAPSSRD